MFGVVDETTTTKFASHACAVHCISLPVVVDKVVVLVLSSLRCKSVNTQLTVLLFKSRAGFYTTLLTAETVFDHLSKERNFRRMEIDSQVLPLKNLPGFDSVTFVGHNQGKIIPEFRRFVLQQISKFFGKRLFRRSKNHLKFVGSNVFHQLWCREPCEMR